MRGLCHLVFFSLFCFISHHLLAHHHYYLVPRSQYCDRLQNRNRYRFANWFYLWQVGYIYGVELGCWIVFFLVVGFFKMELTKLLLHVN